jgi:carboxyl-terminal processing protease
VNDAVMQDFRKFLDDEKVPYTEADLNSAHDWVASHIKAELFVSEFGQQEGLKVQTEADPQVLKALELLPQAKELDENAKRIIAERTSARAAAANQPQ